MMQMLEAGGLPALTDFERAADVDNPKGYYEFEPAKKTAQDPSWLRNAGGKVVKMVYRLLYDLPERGYAYRVVFMQRKLSEVLRSQAKMLARLNTDAAPVDDEQMAALFQRQLDDCLKWLAGQQSFTFIEVPHAHVLSDPLAQARRINDFLGGELDEAAMARVVDPSLYRNRAT